MKKLTQREYLSFYSLYHKKLFIYINKKIHDVSTSEELVQDVFVAFAEEVRLGVDVKSVNSYLYGIARHKISDFIRKKRVKYVFFSGVPERVVDMCASFIFREEVSQNELRDNVHSVLSRLPHDYAVIIRLKYIEGLAVRQIAERLSLKFKSVESMLFRARKTFSKLYNSL